MAAFWVYTSIFGLKSQSTWDNLARMLEKTINVFMSYHYVYNNLLMSPILCPLNCSTMVKRQIGVEWQHKTSYANTKKTCRTSTRLIPNRYRTFTVQYNNHGGVEGMEGVKGSLVGRAQRNWVSKSHFPALFLLSIASLSTLFKYTCDHD
ncbi:hypothetical protein PHYBLDRAFT_59367 [Phycomyces blakesleeanus NRRL 1555(-)]|uniref:Uncharacterized protein n=1 Tax=Phycomyces blakesleeanus (strain ATCC 8743b / DSM 1359 / FGSC 10004 / NBRC 33097 / NRRL 1555) TaxID=763407 RepID=A0A162XNM9_PHYB8|nr:hypothetical protein PHYBLDRAFT_59367 [Phycomyces blakesleeanus NRRL 1555(-)]OAD75835.1 hypothetical protein PHYBLDRAFT_59367 [Phycomyces blakesleeanus NRRL 1555(-)]|eukprot:XP_018293875.1 hypothetical protein PHYBLDRAFT_59367 [Phycomyces blakesleeanus NRRL 1555(-)]